MKRQDITFQDKMNELRLDISHPKSKGICYILVEGDSDIRLYRKFFDLTKCKVESIPGGKFKLQECVSLLIKHNPLIVGICDSDFTFLQEIKQHEDNIFLTDYHDIEMTILSYDDVITAIFNEFTNIVSERHIELRHKMMKSIQLIGYLKWLNFKENLELEFSPGFQDLISFVTESVNFKDYWARIKSKSPSAVVKDYEVIVAKVEALKEYKPNLLHLTCGHDLLKVFTKLFREEQKFNGLNESSLESSLRMLFTKEHFASTRLFESISKWAKLNNCAIFAR